MNPNAKLDEQLHVSMYELDAEGPADVTWVSIEEFMGFMALVMRTVGTGGLDEFRILGNSAADGSGEDVELLDYADLGTLADVNAVGDVAQLCVSAADIDAARTASNLPIKGISVSLGHVTATDESVVTYIRGPARFMRSLLTPQDVIA